MAFSTEIDQLVAELEIMRAEQERVDAVVSGWTRSGETDPYFSFFRANTGYFDTIPHPAASVITGTDSSMGNSTILSSIGGWTSDSGGAWAFDVQVVSSEGIISPKNQPEDSIWGFTAWMKFEASSAGRRSMQWIETGGAGGVSVDEFSPSSAEITQLVLSHTRRAGASDVAYELHGYQNSGTSLAIEQALLAAYRIR